MLHLVNKSPFERTNLQACLQRAAPKSAILLLEDAVYGSLKGTVLSDLVGEAVNTFDVFVLEPDLVVRGLDAEQILQGVKPIGYDEFVDLTVARGTVQSWL
ncbi:MAG: sulfurtransferase complex subunit TusB [Rhodospirillales bacterium]|nr:sulfurtransferase complex subunit TusB [Rhodospirillales bacterium]